MKCHVCGQEFGNGAYCQHCNADRITALGNYSEEYNPRKTPTRIQILEEAPKLRILVLAIPKRKTLIMV